MILSLNGVSKKFDGRAVLDNFSYDFKESGIVAITGVSGVGKTTLLRIILGLEKKYDGEVVVKEGLKFSVSFQEHRLLPNLTALQNVAELVFDKPSEKELMSVEEMLLHLGFSKEEMSLYPHQLSGGMKQRVSLARAFMRKCDILILDEPTKELDSKLVQTVLEDIKEYSKSKLVIIVSHIENDISYLDADIIELTQKTVQN